MSLERMPHTIIISCIKIAIIQLAPIRLRMLTVYLQFNGLMITNKNRMKIVTVIGESVAFSKIILWRKLE